MLFGNLFHKIFALVGYEISRKKVPGTTQEAFAVQQELMDNQEPVIFDVGANDGSVTLLYRNLFPHAKIISFEPSPYDFETLRKRTAGDERILVYPLAISDKKEKVILHQNASSPTNSLLPTNSKGKLYWGEGLLETRDKIEVEAVSIDCFCKKNSIKIIDLLKLDIQGYEYMALIGAQEMLKTQSISLIYTEIILVPTYEDQHKLYEYLNLLDSCDYELINLYNPVHKNKQLVQADFLFMSAKTHKTFQGS